MSASIEERLLALFESSDGPADAPREVFRRLRFLARALRAFEPAEDGPHVVWFDAAGAVQSRRVTAAGIVIGRQRDCDVALPGLHASRHHCRLWLENGCVNLADLNSSNGTKVNGAGVGRTSSAVEDGDVIEVGGMDLALLGERSRKPLRAT